MWKRKEVKNVFGVTEHIEEKWSKHEWERERKTNWMNDREVCVRVGVGVGVCVCVCVWHELEAVYPDLAKLCHFGKILCVRQIFEGLFSSWQNVEPTLANFRCCKSPKSSK